MPDELILLICVPLYLTTFFVIACDVEGGGVELVFDGFGGSEQEFSAEDIIC